MDVMLLEQEEKLKLLVLEGELLPLIYSKKLIVTFQACIKFDYYTMYEHSVVCIVISLTKCLRLYVIWLELHPLCWHSLSKFIFAIMPLLLERN